VLDQSPVLLITGATGLVGSELLRRLLPAKQGRRIVVLSRQRVKIAGFGLSLECARAVNTEGTRNLLKLASECGNLRKFAHLSTVYVAGREIGHFREGPIRHQSGFCNTYQQSKYDAEQLVLRAMNELPVAIFRLSSIIGDSHRHGEAIQLCPSTYEVVPPKCASRSTRRAHRAH